jgi:hypothetical protein
MTQLKRPSLPSVPPPPSGIVSYDMSPAFVVFAIDQDGLVHFVNLAQVEYSKFNPATQRLVIRFTSGRDLVVGGQDATAIAQRFRNQSKRDPA